jgi:hypothetical protein
MYCLCIGGCLSKEIIQLLPLDLVRRDAATEGLDEGLPKEGPVAGAKPVECPAELASERVNVTNEHVDMLWFRQLVVICEGFELFQKVFKCSKASREVRCNL